MGHGIGGEGGQQLRPAHGAFTPQPMAGVEVLEISWVSFLNIPLT